MNATNSAYPTGAGARDRFVLDRRGPRPSHDPWEPQGLLVEDEPTGDGDAGVDDGGVDGGKGGPAGGSGAGGVEASDGRPAIARVATARVATVFLTGRECPWRCVMCDLWQHTIAEDTPSGAIPAQIATARRALREQGHRFRSASDVDRSGHSPRPASGPPFITQMKLYNAGSFFDPRAVPESDYDEIALRLVGLSRVIVECHPVLVGARVDKFLSALERAAAGPRIASVPPRLEVAMGLETAHPEALDKLHKRFTLDQFTRAAEGLRQRGVALRVFLLIAPPFVPHGEQDAWLLRSIDVAFECGASAVSLIPTRSGNGALEALSHEPTDGQGAAAMFRPPTLDDIERSADLALAHVRARGRLFVDLWEIERFAGCPSCREARRVRLSLMNLEQRVSPRLPACPECSHSDAALPAGTPS